MILTPEPLAPAGSGQQLLCKHWQLSSSHRRRLKDICPSLCSPRFPLNSLASSHRAITPEFTPQIQTSFEIKREEFTELSLSLRFRPLKKLLTREHSLLHAFWSLHLGRLVTRDRGARAPIRRAHRPSLPTGRRQSRSGPGPPSGPTGVCHRASMTLHQCHDHDDCLAPPGGGRGAAGRHLQHRLGP